MGRARGLVARSARRVQVRPRGAARVGSGRLAGAAPRVSAGPIAIGRLPFAVVRSKLVGQRRLRGQRARRRRVDLVAALGHQPRAGLASDKASLRKPQARAAGAAAAARAVVLQHAVALRIHPRHELLGAEDLRRIDVAVIVSRRRDDQRAVAADAHGEAEQEPAHEERRPHHATAGSLTARRAPAMPPAVSRIQFPATLRAPG